MDAPGHPRALIDDNLHDLRRVNRLLGGVRLAVAPLARLARRVPAREALRILDVATGAADIPRELCRWADGHGRQRFVVASDVSLEILRSARDHEAVPVGLCFVVADATRLPFRAGAFDVVTSSLALHHFSPEEALAALREQRRCARVAVLINDIVRSWVTYAGAVVAVRLGSRNRLTRHDGPLSALRAYTVDEMRGLARKAGLTPVEWHSFLFYRVSLTATV